MHFFRNVFWFSSGDMDVWEISDTEVMVFIRRCMYGMCACGWTDGYRNKLRIIKSHSKVTPKKSHPKKSHSPSDRPTNIGPRKEEGGSSRNENGGTELTVLSLMAAIEL